MGGTATASSMRKRPSRLAAFTSIFLGSGFEAGVFIEVGDSWEREVAARRS